MLITVNNTSAASAGGVRDCEVDTRMRWPKPVLRPDEFAYDDADHRQVMATLSPTNTRDGKSFDDCAPTSKRQYAERSSAEPYG